MKVYFACSISGGRESAHLYQNIVDAIKSNGVELLSELFADQSIEANKVLSVSKNMTKQDVWEWDLNWVKEADVIIAEVTQPSLGVGYEIAKAEEWKKPILTLFYEPSGKRLSSMIEGSTDNTTVYYSDADEAKDAVIKFLRNIAK
jgi:hypothetical protein